MGKKRRILGPKGEILVLFLDHELPRPIGFQSPEVRGAFFPAPTRPPAFPEPLEEAGPEADEEEDEDAEEA